MTSTSAYTIYASTGMGATLFWLAGADPLEGALAGLQLGVGLALAPSLKSKVEAVIVEGFAGSAELMFNVYKGKSIRDAKVWAETFRVFSEGVFESALDAWGIRRYGPGADANDVALVNSMILGARGLVKQVFYDQHTPIQYRLEKIMKYILEGMFSLATANAWFFLPHKVGHQISKKLENVSLDKEFKDTIINGVSDGVLHMARYFVAASASYHTFKK